jgi:hypothetical protein
MELQGFELIEGTVDTTVAAIVKLTGECTNGGDTIKQYFWSVEKI